MEKKQLIDFLSGLLIPIGFKKKGSYWVLNGDEITKMVNLQQSQYSNRFYINYGYVLKSIPLNNLRMHIFKGLGSADIKENSRIKELLDLENNTPDGIRTTELKEFLNNLLIKNMLSVNTEQDLLKEIKNLPTLNMVPGVIKEYFNL